MKWFNNLKVAYKVLLSCTLLILLLVAAIFFSFTAMKNVQEKVKDYTDNRVPAVVKMDSFAKNILQGKIISFSMTEERKAGNLQEVKRLLGEIVQIRDDNVKLLKYIKDRKMTEEERVMTNKYVDFYVKMGEKMNAYNASLKTGNKQMMDAAKNEWTAQYVAVIDHLKQLQSLTLKTGDENIRAALEGIPRIFIIMGLILLFSLTAGIFITYALSRAVSKPVKLGLAFAQKLIEGDLTDRIKLDQNDELGMLSNSLNKAADNLEMLISEVNTSVNNLTLAVNDISNGNQNLSQRTGEQASSLEEIASTIEQTTATIAQNADNAGRARELTDAGAAKSMEGNKIALEAVHSIVDMNESSKRVADIIAVINEIAFQTNLLALNAAVEAARAGEQGRGFAVVASEVRNLAQRSGTAAKEIAALIKDTINKVERSTNLVNKTGDSLNEIAEASKKSAQIIQEIAAASQEQKQGISQINNAIIEMDNMTQQNAALVEETAASSEEMANQAQDLLQMMRRFKVSNVIKRSSFDEKRKDRLSGAGEDAAAVGKKITPEHDDKITDRKEAVKVSPIPARAEGKTGDIKKIMTSEGFDEF